jgi:hypothetical protein
MPRLDNSQIDRLTKFLGRPIAHEENSCQDYSEITELQLKDIGELACGVTTLDAILYVMFLIGERCSLRNASSFVDNVTKKNMSVADWLQNYYQQD